jgi:hypothetical protein
MAIRHMWQVANGLDNAVLGLVRGTSSQSFSMLIAYQDAKF